MGLAVVKSWSARASGSNSLTLTLTGETIAAGDLLHVATYLFANLTLAPAAPTDSAGASNTYTTRTGAAWSSTFRSICGSAWSVVAVAPTTVTVNRTGATSPDIAGAVYHITGAKTSSPVNTSTANDTTSSTPTHTAMSSAQAAEIWFVDGTHDGGNITCTKPTGFTQGETNGNGSTGEPYFSGYQIFSTTQTALAPAWALTASANIGLTMVAYEAAAGGGTDAIVPASITAPCTVGGAVTAKHVVAPTSITAPVSVSGKVNAKHLVAAASITAPCSVSSTVTRKLAVAGAITAPVTVTAGLQMKRAITTASITVPVIVNATVTGGSGGVTIEENQAPPFAVVHHYYGY